MLTVNWMRGPKGKLLLYFHCTSECSLSVSSYYTDFYLVISKMHMTLEESQTGLCHQSERKQCLLSRGTHKIYTDLSSYSSGTLALVV